VTRSVLDVDLNPGGVAAARATSTSWGRFDGERFTSDEPPTTTLWADYGKDFYATLSFANLAPADGRPIWMGWMSNWLYANDEPTSPWRGMQSVPRALALRRRPEGLRLVQSPVAELSKLRTAWSRGWWRAKPFCPARRTSSSRSCEGLGRKPACAFPTR
jgi:sucrose-6-phosphate hydrolase SacC (GH32 family)